MAHEPNDIQSQLDELLNEASEPDGSADDAPKAEAPPDQRRAEAAAEAPTHADPMDELANEARSAAEEPAAEPPAPAADPTAPDASDTQGTPAEDVERLDARLADEAEEALAGDFETVDQAMRQAPGEAAQDAPSESHTGPPPTGDAALDEALDELVEGGPAPGEQAPAAPGAPGDHADAAAEEREASDVAAKTATEAGQAADRPSEDAAAVAAELDADEAAPPAGESQATPAAQATAEPVPAAPAFGASFWNEAGGEANPDKDEPGWHGLASASPSPGDAPAKDATQRRTPRPSPLALARRGAAAAGRALLIGMATINRPIMRFPPWVRDVIGLAGVMTLFMGLGLIVYARWGAVAVAGPAALLTTAFAALFYLLFLRDPSRLAEAAAMAEDDSPRDP